MTPKFVLMGGFAHQRCGGILSMFRMIIYFGGQRSPCQVSDTGSSSILSGDNYDTISEIEGVRVLTPHSCRHTYVSQLQALGVDLATIQSIVGHADVDMTQHYLHVQDSIRQDAINRFAFAFGSDKNTLD